MTYKSYNDFSDYLIEARNKRGIYESQYFPGYFVSLKKKEKIGNEL